MTQRAFMQPCYSITLQGPEQLCDPLRGPSPQLFSLTLLLNAQFTCLCKGGVQTWCNQLPQGTAWPSKLAGPFTATTQHTKGVFSFSYALSHSLSLTLPCGYLKYSPESAGSLITSLLHELQWKNVNNWDKSPFWLSFLCDIPLRVQLSGVVSWGSL